jgi:NAD(P)-dependent dehydrogenase (short-subunit alcohol dehydrogenase family)
MSTALVIGSSGAIGSALLAGLQAQGQGHAALGLSRSSSPALDLLDEASMANAAQWVRAQCAESPLRTLIVATGSLHSAHGMPEKSLSQLSADYLQHQFAVNAVGPMLLMKHFLPLMPTQAEVRAVFISAKVGSIGDNALGGWYGYRAAKAALNQAVKTASIELARRNKSSICIALHPGTVQSRLSEPFHKTGLNVRPPEAAAQQLLSVIASLTPERSGQLIAHDGSTLPW